jgi:cobalamin-dependent methionine synthase I
VADRAVLVLVTIGDGIERAVETYREQGQLAPALVFDAFGSAAAEAAAAAAEEAVREAVEVGGMRCSRRFSPGYGGWNVAEQRWILEALDGADVGVSLTRGCMMTPRKSVTFAMTVGADPIELRRDDVCASCGVADCEWRDTPERCERRSMR